MPKKETKDMLIRDVPYDVWERVDRICRRLKITRRDFVERCVGFFENDGEQEVWEKEVAKARDGWLQILSRLLAIKYKILSRCR